MSEISVRMLKCREEIGNSKNAYWVSLLTEILGVGLRAVSEWRGDGHGKITTSIGRHSFCDFIELLRSKKSPRWTCSEIPSGINP